MRRPFLGKKGGEGRRERRAGGGKNYRSEEGNKRPLLARCGTHAFNPITLEAEHRQVGLLVGSHPGLPVSSKSAEAI